MVFNKQIYQYIFVRNIFAKCNYSIITLKKLPDVKPSLKEQHHNKLKLKQTGRHNNCVIVIVKCFEKKMQKKTKVKKKN